MEVQPIPEELLALRDQIDAIDAEMMDLLARRFQVTRQVGKLKAEKHLSSFDPVRERQKLERLQALAEDSDLDPEFVLSLFQSIFNEVVANHKRFQQS
jgi:chorismate mutase